MVEGAKEDKEEKPEGEGVQEGGESLPENKEVGEPENRDGEDTQNATELPEEA